MSVSTSKPIKFNIVTEIGDRVVKGWRSSVPGLVVHEHRPGCWHVTHAISGRTVTPFGFTSIDDAQKFCDGLAELPWNCVFEDQALVEHYRDLVKKELSAFKRAGMQGGD